MLLLPLWTKEDTWPTWEVYSIAGEDKSCPIANALGEILKNGNNNRHAKAMVALIRTISSHEDGPKIYEGTTVCHEAVSGEGIFAFRKGDLRLYWFYGSSRRMVIFPHLDTKNTQKTSKTLAKELVRLKHGYVRAAREGRIILGDI